MKEKPIIIPYDGIFDPKTLIGQLRTDLNTPGIVELLAFVKFNDAVFSPGLSGPGWIGEFSKIIEECKVDVGIFLDLKLSDTSGTVKNDAKRFASFQQKILTVRSNLSGRLKSIWQVPSCQLRPMASFTLNSILGP